MAETSCGRTVEDDEELEALEEQQGMSAAESQQHAGARDCGSQVGGCSKEGCHKQQPQRCARIGDPSRSSKAQGLGL